MPLVSYRASAEAVLHKIHEVAGRRQSAKQVHYGFPGKDGSGRRNGANLACSVEHV